METALPSDLPLWELIEFEEPVDTCAHDGLFNVRAALQAGSPSWVLSIVPVMMGLVVALDLGMRYLGQQGRLSWITTDPSHFCNPNISILYLLAGAAAAIAAMTLLWACRQMRFRVRTIAVGASLIAGGTVAIALELLVMPGTLNSAYANSPADVALRFHPMVYDWISLAGQWVCIADLAIGIGLIIVFLGAVCLIPSLYRAERKASEPVRTSRTKIFWIVSVTCLLIYLSSLLKGTPLALPKMYSLYALAVWSIGFGLYTRLRPVRAEG